MSGADHWASRFHADQQRLDAFGWLASAASVALVLAAGTALALRLDDAEGLRDAGEDTVLLELEPLPPAPAVQALSAPAPDVPMTDAPEAPELVEEATPPDTHAPDTPLPDTPVPEAAPLADLPPPLPDDLTAPDPPPPPPLPEPEPEPEPEPMPEPEPLPVPEPVPEPEAVAQNVPRINPPPRPDRTAKAEPAPNREARQEPRREAPAAAKSPPPSQAAVASSQAAAPKATGTAPAAVSKGQLRDLMGRWGGQIQTRVQRRLAYPRGADGAEGEVVLRLAVATSGQLRSVQIIRSSGHGVLDAAALRIAKAAGPFPKAPAGLTGDSLTFSIPLRFTVRN